MAPEGAFLRDRPHPRAYGAFARVLGHYVREAKLLTLPEEVRRMSGLPASVLGLEDRGLLRDGYHADVAVFDPTATTETATLATTQHYTGGADHDVISGQDEQKKEQTTGR